MPPDPLHDDAPYRDFERKYHDLLEIPSLPRARAMGEALKHVLMDIFNRLARVEREHDGR